VFDYSTEHGATNLGASPVAAPGRQDMQAGHIAARSLRVKGSSVVIQCMLLANNMLAQPGRQPAIIVARLMGQYCFARWCLLSVGVVCRRL